MRRLLFIQTETTPNEHALKFRPGKPVLPAASDHPILEFQSVGEARKGGSPLAMNLLRVEGVKGVLLARDFITVNKQPLSEWVHLKPAVYSAIMDFYALGEPAVRPPPPEAVRPDESETMQLIREVLDTRIRPIVQDDGGDVELVRFDEKTGFVQLMLRGACRSCSSATLTLRNGIETMLMHYIPEVKGVVALEEGQDPVVGEQFAATEQKNKKGR